MGKHWLKWKIISISIDKIGDFIAEVSCLRDRRMSYYKNVLVVLIKKNDVIKIKSQRYEIKKASFVSCSVLPSNSEDRDHRGEFLMGHADGIWFLKKNICVGSRAHPAILTSSAFTKHSKIQHFFFILIIHAHTDLFVKAPSLICRLATCMISIISH